AQLAETQAETREVIDADHCYRNETEDVEANRPARCSRRRDAINGQPDGSELLEYPEKAGSGREGNPYTDQQLEEKCRGKTKVNSNCHESQPECERVHQPMRDCPRKDSREVTGTFQDAEPGAEADQRTL